MIDLRQGTVKSALIKSIHPSSDRSSWLDLRGRLEPIPGSRESKADVHLEYGASPLQGTHTTTHCGQLRDSP